MSEEYRNNEYEQETNDNENHEVKSSEGQTGFVISNFQPQEESNEQHEEPRTEYPNSEENSRTEDTTSSTDAREEYVRFNTYQEPNSQTSKVRNHYVKEEFYKEDKKHKKERNSKKSGGFVKRAACFVLAAAVFGSVAGGTMVGINVAAKKAGIVAEASTTSAASQIEQAQTVAATTSTSTSTQGTTVMDVSAVVENVMPTVVAITNSQIYKSYSMSPYEYFFGGGSSSYGSDSSSSDEDQYEEVGAGSGIIIDKNDTELLIVTNNHVVEDADALTITFADESTADAVVKGTDSDTDLAVVSVQLSDLSSDTLSAIKTATIGSSDDAKVGEGVIAIGNALGYGQSVTVGYISALNRTIQTDENVSRTVLQTDAAINPGNSGGALVNTKGELIGINCAKYSSTDVEGVGYAIPISLASSIIDNLKTKEAKVKVENEDEQGYLGIQAATISSQSASAYGMPAGVYVYSIEEGGAAAKSDLKEKDIITKFDGETLTSNQDLIDILQYYKGGTTVELTVETLQDGQYVEHTVTVTLGYAKDKTTTSSNSNSSNK
jgi:serine protease Do